ncbi:hypothetical protein GCM10020255_084690 [Rhodococcus baikonurensis]
MQVADANTEFEKVIGQIFRHLLGQRRDQHTLVAFRSLADFVNEIVDLSLGRFDDDLGIDQSSRANHLLDELTA